MAPVFSDVFTEMAVLLLVAAVIGAIGVRLRQPLIVAFIAVGILVGPSVLGWVSANDQVDLLAKLGIALLLFVVGLKLDLHIIRTMGPVALATGLGQVFFTSVVGYFIAIALGMTPVTAVYVAVALTFSSTIIIVKLLSDKRELDALHGRIAIGLLIVQDIVVVLVMIGLTALGEAGDAASLGREAIEVLVKGGLFIAAIGLLMRYVLTPLLHQLARSPELLVLFAIAWAVAQISEFSLILGALGLGLGHIDADTMGLITLVGLITISASTYMILHSHPLYEWISRWLGVFERKRAHREEVLDLTTEASGVDVILFGLGRFGSRIARELRQRGHRVLGVDFDPELVRRQQVDGYAVRYGDAQDPEFLATLPLGQIRWVLNSVREMPANLVLLHGLRDYGYKGRVAVTAHTTPDAGKLRQAGADRVLIPYADAAAEAVDNLFGADVHEEPK